MQREKDDPNAGGPGNGILLTAAYAGNFEKFSETFSTFYKRSYWRSRVMLSNDENRTQLYYFEGPVPVTLNFIPSRGFNGLPQITATVRRRHGAEILGLMLGMISFLDMQLSAPVGKDSVTIADARQYFALTEYAKLPETDKDLKRFLEDVGVIRKQLSLSDCTFDNAAFF